MKAAKDFFSVDEIEQIKSSIKRAELNTSGEIRLHVENHCQLPVLDRATDIFENLEMHKTELRNGVLFYLAVIDKKFAILGDVGINQKVPENFWDMIKDEMQAKFKEGKFVDGLSVGIEKAGEQLKAYFPYKSDDVNELTNDISFGL